jgi:predicted component of type VI protein secretion system
MPSEPLLVAESGPLAGRSWPVTPEGLRIGREDGNEIMVDDAAVSRQHARVLLHNGAVWVQDAGSRNGVFVNGERVPDHRQLKEGDRLTLGAHVFVLGAPAPRSAAARPAPVAPARRARGGVGMFVLFGGGALAILAIVACTGVVLWWWWAT